MSVPSRVPDKKRACFVAVSGLLRFLSVPALAMTSHVALADESGELEEIVVTAEKRESTVQTTPISMTAVTGAVLLEKGITSITQLALQVPGVATKSAGPGQTEFTLRGLASSAGVAPTTGVYFDETPVSPPAVNTTGKSAIDPDLYDLARVEILRGPQGTLYGASSMGGTVKLVPALPDPAAFAASVNTIGSYTEGGSWNAGFNGMVNVPLVNDVTALRVVVTRKHDSGWIDRIVVPDMPIASVDETGRSFSTPRADTSSTPSKIYKNDNSLETTAARAALIVKPNEDLTILPTVFYQSLKQKGTPDAYDRTPGNVDAHYQPVDVAEPFREKMNLYNLKINYSMGGVALTSVSGYSKRVQTNSSDQTETVEKYANGLIPLTGYAIANGGIGTGAIDSTINMTQFTQELRLQSTGEGAWSWIVGGFYSRFKSRYDTALVFPGAADIAGTDNIYSAFYSDVLTQKALFGNVGYQITSKLKATAGVRLFRDSDHFTDGSSGLFSATGSDAQSVPSNVILKASGTNPMVNLAFNVTNDSMVYGTVAKGFRDGAGQFSVSADLCGADVAAAQPKSYGPDTLWSYEVGNKNRLFDHRMTLNVSAYYQQWKGVQQSILLGCGYIYTDNAADATIPGFEIETSTLLPGGFGLDVAFGYAHPRYSTDNASSGTKSGDRLLNVPDVTASTSLRYERPLTEKYSLFGRAGISYVGRTDSQASERITMPSYTLSNFRLGVQSAAWSATLFVDNLSNERVALNLVQNYLANVPGLDRVATVRPRTMGIDFSYKY